MFGALFNQSSVINLGPILHQTPHPVHMLQSHEEKRVARLSYGSSDFIGHANFEPDGLIDHPFVTNFIAVLQPKLKLQ